MKCQKLDLLRSELFTVICGRIKNNKYVVVRRLERQQYQEGMPNGQMMEYFDGPFAAVKWAQTDSATAYEGKKLLERRPNRQVPRVFGDRSDSARMIVRLLLDAQEEDCTNAVKYIVFRMSPADIARFMLRDQEIFCDLYVPVYDICDA